MHCRDAQFYLRLRRHAGDELGAEVNADLQRHLGGCDSCAAEAAEAASFDRVIASSMRSVPVPAGLRDRLFAQASTLHGAVIRRKVFRVAALAASLLVGIGLALGIFSGRPKFPTDALVTISDDLSQQPEVALHRWLVGLGAPSELPHPFDPSLLVTFGKDQVQGKDVPFVVFHHRTNPTEYAKVYILLADGPFDTRDIGNAGISNSVAEVVRDDRHRVTYVILYKNTPDGLKPFLASRNAAI
ncbi:MAG TPA: hypothetical protein VLM40_06105 [Gemmata sp.]|nr:hypothetical protein [Gemmata sp.]